MQRDCWRCIVWRVICDDCGVVLMDTVVLADAEHRYRDHHIGTRHTVRVLGHETCWVDDSLCPDCGLDAGEAQ